MLGGVGCGEIGLGGSVWEDLFGGCGERRIIVTGHRFVYTA